MKYYDGEEEFSQEDDSDEDQRGCQEERKVGSAGKVDS
jgi:hypothetical protein